MPDSYYAIDTARDRLEELTAAKATTKACIRGALWNMQQALGPSRHPLVLERLARELRTACEICDEQVDDLAAAEIEEAEHDIEAEDAEITRAEHRELAR